MRTALHIQLVLVLSVFIAGRVIAQTGTTLTSAEIEQAITIGTTKDVTEFSVGLFARQYRTVLLGRLGQVAAAAWSAKREYKPFSAATLPPDLKRDHVSVSVTPMTPTRGGGFEVPQPVKHVVIRDGAGMVLQPLEVIPRPQEWSNAFGARLSSTGAMAWFAAFPPGDFEVVIVTTTSEVVQPVRGADRSKLQ
jgi:hypothetical protein